MEFACWLPWMKDESRCLTDFFAVLAFLEQSMEDLKHKLLCATSELEALRANAKEEIRKRAENIDQLIRLLQVIAHERDAARDQLQLLLSNISRPNTGEYSPTQTRGSCSVTESDSLSATPNHHSYGGDGASPGSPELRSINMGIPRQQQKYDRASAIIDGLAMKRPLPRKGKLLQAVLEAGPLLQTLLLAGPLPKWRNPPPLQPFQVPPVAAVGLHNASLLDEKIVPDPTNSAVLNIPGGTGLLCTTKRTMASPCMKSFDTWDVKRQKTQCT
ncbi:hypothetical protein GW17_00053384 [Ensete ventricosum]|nr:hypothetical protein GW17_00053384 [Ensete ventricosum]